MRALSLQARPPRRFDTAGAAHRATAPLLVAGSAVCAFVAWHLLAHPVWVIALVPLIAAVAIANRSVALPLALASAAPIIDSIAGADPLPKGGFTVLSAGWILLALVLALIARRVSATKLVLNVPTLASLALLGLLVLRLDGSLDPGYGTTKAALYVADVLVPYLAAIAVGGSRRELRVFLIATLAVATAGAIILSGGLLTGTTQALVGGRFSLAAEQYPIELGRQSATGLLIATALILTATGRARLMLAALIVPLAVALLAAGSRGPVVGLVAGLVVLIGLSGRVNARRGVLILIAALLASAVIAPVLVPGSALGRSLSVLAGGEAGLSSNGRTAIWSVALSNIEAHPLLGIGTGGFAALGTGLLYPHNIVLEVAVETGLAGLVALLALLTGFVASLGLAWRQMRSSDRVTVALIAALFTSAIVNASLSTAIQDNAAVWIAGGLAIGLGARLSARGAKVDV
jgi:O-antigen ligase